VPTFQVELTSKSRSRFRGISTEPTFRMPLTPLQNQGHGGTLNVILAQAHRVTQYWAGRHDLGVAQLAASLPLCMFR
jgi:hypothetical protein